jgi:hypothetical protein
MKIISLAVINGDNTAKTNVPGLKDYSLTTISNDRPMVSFRARKIDKKMLIFLTFNCSNSADTLQLINKLINMLINVE